MRFHQAQARSPWGFLSDASLLPLTSADGASNIDLHVHPDAWPLHLGLSGADVFAAARVIDTGDGDIWVPSVTHMLLLSASHAARDLFGPSTAKSLIDAARLLRQNGGEVDWREFEGRLRPGRVEKPVRAFLAILKRLGADTRAVPERLTQAGGGGIRACGGGLCRFVSHRRRRPGPRPAGAVVVRRTRRRHGAQLATPERPVPSPSLEHIRTIPGHLTGVGALAAPLPFAMVRRHE